MAARRNSKAYKAEQARKRRLKKAKAASGYRKHVQEKRSLDNFRKKWGWSDPNAGFVRRVIEAIHKRSHEMGPDGTGEPTPLDHTNGCLHVTAVGSSEVRKMASDSLDLLATHRRGFRSDHSNAKRYERKAAKIKAFTTVDGIKAEFVAKAEQPARFSRNMPWLVASPDFVARVQYPGIVEHETVLIEVKTTTQKRHHTDGEKQLKAALHVFGLKTGFLVVYFLLTGKRQITRVTQDWDTEKMKQLTDKYCDYLRKSASLVVGDKADDEANIDLKEIMNSICNFDVSPEYSYFQLTKKLSSFGKCNLFGCSHCKKCKGIFPQCGCTVEIKNNLYSVKEAGETIIKDGVAAKQEEIN